MSSSFQLHRDTALLCQRAIEHATRGPGSGRAYTRMAEFVDRFGCRMVGSQTLESAIDWAERELRAADGLTVSTEEFSMPAWSRGHEAAFITAPVTRELSILGLGYSPETPEAGLEAECLVVRSFDELEAAAAEGRLSGKIAVFNQPWAGYEATRHYRNSGPARAAQLGAVAALVRSVTPFSIDTPHAGVTQFQDGCTAIPAACVSLEGAELLDRLQSRGGSVRLRLVMRCQTMPDTKSRNIIADLPGSDPSVAHELVVLCAHLDSWDVGQGAMDDAGGAFVAWEAVRTLRALGLSPRRTVRLILFSGEELGLWGGRRYFEAHAAELGGRISFMLESDGGTFGSLGVTCSGTPDTLAALRLAMQPLGPCGSGGVFEGLDGPDIVQWADVGVPIGNLVTQRAGQSEDFYFYFHHTRGDTVTVQDPAEMDSCVATLAAVALALGNAEGLLPR